MVAATAFTIFSFAVTWGTLIQVGLLLYSINRQRKLAKKMAALQDAQKGFEIVSEAENASIPIVYGRNLIGGTRVWFRTASGYTHDENVGAQALDSFNNNLTANAGGEKNEYLFIQQVLSHGPIHKVYDIVIQGDRYYNNDDFKPGLRVNVHKEGSFADKMITANFGDRATAIFDKLAYASMVFKLNRDDPQYQGIPEVQFIIEGLKVRKITKSGDSYTLNQDKEYSNNPAYCLLDYLLSTEYGRGLNVTSIDLETFYKAAQVCEKEVQYGASVEGKIWKPTNESRVVYSRTLPLYECNLTLDPEQPIRDNIETLLETMNGAELVWSGGQYKLLLQYPFLGEELEVAGLITDDDIVRDSVDIGWPSASERLNYVNIKFRNEALNFKEDTASWPPKDEQVYATYFAQDGNIPLESDFFDPGIKDKYHALAKAEERVRRSRSICTYQFKLNISNSLYEPGDIIRIESDILKIYDYIQLTEIKLNSDNTAQVSGYRFVKEVLAWNAKDNEVVNPPITFDFSIKPPTNIVYAVSNDSDLQNTIGILSWDTPTTGMPYGYIIEYIVDNEFKYLGTSSGNSFEIYNLKAGDYYFSVRSRSATGRLSERTVSGLIKVVDGTESIVAMVLDDDIIKNNNNVITRLIVNITSDEPMVFGRYEVDYKLKSSTTWTNLGSGKSVQYILNNVKEGEVYEVRVKTVNAYGASGPYTQSQRLIIGKLEPPSTVTGFAANQTFSKVTLTWNPIPDVDLNYYIISQGPTIDEADVIATTVESFYELPPISKGNYKWWIKAVDTTGNVSVDYATTTLSISGPERITNLTRTLVESSLILSWTASVSIFPIVEYRIKSNGTVISNIKSTTYTLPVNWVGNREFSVVAVDSSNQESEPVNTSFNVTAPTFPGNFRTQVIDNNVLLYWTETRGTLPTREYVLRRGNTLAESELIGTTSALFTTYFEIRANNYTYWVAAKDTAGNIGAYASTSVIVNQPPDYELAVDYYTDFNKPTSTRVNMAPAELGYLMPIDNTQTWTSHFTSNSNINIQEFIDDGYGYFIQPSINQSGVDAYYEETYDLGTTFATMQITLNYTGVTLSGNPVVLPYISTSLDGITFEPYTQDQKMLGVNFRYVKFKITVDGGDSKGVYNLRQINLVLDAKAISDSGKVTCNASDPGGTLVLFHKSFVDITSIIVTPSGTTPAIAIYDFDGSVANPTGFKVLLFNTSGARINGEASWTVKGY